MEDRRFSEPATLGRVYSAVRSVRTVYLVGQAANESNVNIIQFAHMPIGKTPSLIGDFFVVNIYGL